MRTITTARLVPKNNEPSAIAFKSNGAEHSRYTKVGRWTTGNMGINLVKNMCRLLSRKRAVKSVSSMWEVMLKSCCRHDQYGT
jgi:hypothetical protein